MNYGSATDESTTSEGPKNWKAEGDLGQRSRETRGDIRDGGIQSNRQTFSKPGICPALHLDSLTTTRRHIRLLIPVNFGEIQARCPPLKHAAGPKQEPTIPPRIHDVPIPVGGLPRTGEHPALFQVGEGFR